MLRIVFSWDRKTPSFVHNDQLPEFAAVVEGVSEVINYEFE